MANIRYQMNKSSMQKLQKELKTRLEALPTLKSKETALRVEVKKAKEEFENLTENFKKLLEDESKNAKIWMEYPSLLRINNLHVDNKNIAGVKVPILREIEFSIRDHSLYTQRGWVPKGTEILKNLSTLKIKTELKKKEMEILYHARKKTTQKVNLYEKVQIPGFKEAIGKIKRFLEDEENLSRAGQKIIKAKKEKEEENSSLGIPINESYSEGIQ